MKYRPFTLEGNFAFASGVQDMLIQSHTGITIIFPAVPGSWKDVAFSTLRTEGAFLVSAQQKGGEVLKVKIVSEKGGIYRMKNPFGTQSYNKKLSWNGAVKTDGVVLFIDFPQNGVVELSAK